MSTHVVHFTTGLTAASAEGLRNACLSALSQGATGIRIHISCEGGPTIHSFTLYNFLRSLPVPLTMHNIGKVESMALPVFLAGSHRTASPHSSFLIHPLHWDFGQGRVDYLRLVEYADRLKEDVERYVDIFTEATSAAAEPLSVRPYLTNRHKTFPGKAALVCGIVHEVSEAQLPPGAVLWWVSGQGSIESSK